MLGQIEQDVLGDRPLASTLRRCIMLGGYAGSTALRDWAKGELHGYYGKDADGVPEYRQMPLPLYADAIVNGAMIKGQQISSSLFPEWAREPLDKPYVFRQGIGEIEGMIKTCEQRSEAGLHLGLPMSVEMGNLIDQMSGNPSQRIMELYWFAHVTALRGIVDHVRTSLAELVAEIRAGLPPDQETPSAELADHAVSVAAYGKARVTINTVQARDAATVEIGEAAKEERSPFWTRSKLVGAFVVGAATIAGTVVGIIQLVNS